MGAEDEIAAGARSIADAINAGSGTEAAGHYTADGAIFPPGAGRLDGHEAIADYWQAVIEAGLSNLAITPSEVVVTGDTASDIGTLTGSIGGQAISGKYFVLWKQEDGAWKMHRDIWNFDA